VDGGSDTSAGRATQPHAVGEVPRPVEHANRHTETLPGERMPRPVVPDPTHEPE